MIQSVGEPMECNTVIQSYLLLSKKERDELLYGVYPVAEDQEAFASYKPNNQPSCRALHINTLFLGLLKKGLRHQTHSLPTLPYLSVLCSPRVSCVLRELGVFSHESAKHKIGRKSHPVFYFLFSQTQKFLWFSLSTIFFEGSKITKF